VRAALKGTNIDGMFFRNSRYFDTTGKIQSRIGAGSGKSLAR
jgi:hypothetical protein